MELVFFTCKEHCNGAGFCACKELLLVFTTLRRMKYQLDSMCFVPFKKQCVLGGL